MRTPRTLPDAPTDDEVRALLRAAPTVAGTVLGIVVNYKNSKWKTLNKNRS
jgi:hypothetical protein